MRDDLHKTVPLPRPWLTVLRFASREADWPRLADAMSCAVRLTVENGIDPKWGASLKASLASASDSLFPDESLDQVFSDFGRMNPTSIGRQVCEVAQGLYARDGNAHSLYDRALIEVCRQRIAPNIEHVTAAVYRRHDLHQSRQVFERLNLESKKCRFEPRQPRQRRSKAERISDLLNESIGLRT